MFRLICYNASDAFAGGRGWFRLLLIVNRKESGPFAVGRIGNRSSGRPGRRERQRYDANGNRYFHDLYPPKLAQQARAGYLRGPNAMAAGNFANFTLPGTLFEAKGGNMTLPLATFGPDFLIDSGAVRPAADRD